MLLMSGLMGAYLGVNQYENVCCEEAGAPARTVPSRVVSVAGLWAAGHLLGMLIFLLPLAAIVALLAGTSGGDGVLETLHTLLCAALIGFAGYKLWRPEPPRLLPRWRRYHCVTRSLATTILDCGSPIMMSPMLVLMCVKLQLAQSAPRGVWGMAGKASVLAVMIAGTMALVLFLTSAALALVNRGSGLRISELTGRFNMDLGWTLMFLAMGAAGLLSAW